VAEQFGGFQVELGQGVRRGPELRHDRGGLGTVTHHVAHDDAGLARGQGNQVIPVAADDLPGGGQAADGPPPST
jgi:hypothetical protein